LGVVPENFSKLNQSSFRINLKLEKEESRKTIGTFKIDKFDQTMLVEYNTINLIFRIVYFKCSKAGYN